MHIERFKKRFTNPTKSQLSNRTHPVKMLDPHLTLSKSNPKLIKSNYQYSTIRSRYSTKPLLFTYLSTTISIVWINVILASFLLSTSGVCGTEQSGTTTGTDWNDESSLLNQRDDIFSSTSRMEDLVHSELQVIDLLETFAEYTIEKANLVKTYVDRQKSILRTRQAKDIVAHPVEAYLFLRRLTADWEDVHNSLGAIANYSQGVFTWVETFRERINFPQWDDLNGAALALVRLQDTYLLEPKSISSGHLIMPMTLQEPGRELHSLDTLSARDLLFLGKHAFTLGLYNRAIDWLREAERLAGSDKNATGLLEEISPSLRSAIQVHDDVLERQGPSGHSWRTNPVPINPELAKSIKYQDVEINNSFRSKLFQRQTEYEEMDHYTRLCRGEKLRPIAMVSTLKCRIERKGSHYFILSPLKIEEESHDPYIVVIHEFLSEKETNHIINLGKPKLLASMHQSRNGTFIKSSIRTSKTAWLKDFEDSLMGKVTKKVELITGLRATEPKEAEDYQVANYGLGGLYVPHTDHLMNNPNREVYTAWEQFVGDRIATLMIYLSDVEGGGATVFPRAGVTLWPKRGSAAFWWNLDRSGIGDENTRHGACPVLYGSKWVSNKWLRLNEQFLNAPCGLHSLQKFMRP